LDSELHALPDDEGVALLMERAREAHLLGSDHALNDVSRFLRVIRSNRVALSAYRPHAYPGRLCLFRVEEHEWAREADSTLGWAPLSLSGVEVCAIPGDHLTLMIEPHVQILADRLTACLRGMAGTLVVE
jgi:thioesterase domain-containing protein